MYLVHVQSPFRKKTTPGLFFFFWEPLGFHVKMAHYIFSVDENAKIRDDVKVNGANDYAKVVENRIAM